LLFYNLRHANYVYGAIFPFSTKKAAGGLAPSLLLVEEWRPPLLFLASLFLTNLSIFFFGVIFIFDEGTMEPYVIHNLISALWGARLRLLGHKISVAFVQEVELRVGEIWVL